jgi:hypothetical protein
MDLEARGVMNCTMLYKSWRILTKHGCITLAPCVTPAKDAYVECRQVAKADGLPIYTSPSGAAVTPGITLPQCQRIEFVPGQKKDVGGSCWIGIRYRAVGSTALKYGWVQGNPGGCGDPGESYVDPCPSLSSACAQKKACRQVFSVANPIFKDAPCWVEANRLVDVPVWGMVQYHGSYSKQTSKCPNW